MMSSARSLCTLRTSAIVPAARNHRPVWCRCQRRRYATASDRYKTPTFTENPLIRQSTLSGQPAVTERASPTSTTSKANRVPTKGQIDRDPETMAAKLDPVPSWRKKWERRKVMNSVRRRGRLTQSEVIKRTEREGVYKSEMWKTSMKKLAPLARQIAGKTVDEAIVQMDFSKKKNATWIKDFLKKAQVTAHVERGMGIPDDLPGKKQRLAAERKAAGLPPLTPDALNKASLDKDTTDESESATPEPKTTIVDEKEEREPEDPLEKIRAAIRKARKEALDQRIFLKDGSPHSIASPTNMYIAQAWVNKGSYGTDIIKRARGRRDRLMLPQTSISIIVKEEVTRIREHQQRQEKEAKRKPWIQLPNRPITASHSRPFYTW